ncbi:hypothetical protein MBVG596_1181 [Mycoplasmopsis bovigenitalium]|uniref:hypothetical protein n=1 Tax=Mycoplasmopsis bovigenitalium TaxID=2112 RepID=UPI00090ACF5A|nr:hypothetical protein [Mycoplasmopsis bovigenitalium]BAW18616.1 hypothetical protein MBVG596_1181 [Mycoplasmopsis bovigenitalium]
MSKTKIILASTLSVLAVAGVTTAAVVVTMKNKKQNPKPEIQNTTESKKETKPLTKIQDIAKPIKKTQPLTKIQEIAKPTKILLDAPNGVLDKGTGYIDYRFTTSKENFDYLKANEKNVELLFEYTNTSYADEKYSAGVYTHDPKNPTIFTRVTHSQDGKVSFTIFGEFRFVKGQVPQENFPVTLKGLFIKGNDNNLLKNKSNTVITNPKQ